MPPDDLDPADLPQLYAAIRNAEARGDQKTADRLEKLLDQWFDSHEEYQEDDE